MARYFNKDSMSDTFDHIQKVVLPPVTTPLESLLAERQQDALCSVHVAAEDYPEHVDRAKRLKMSFLFCRKEAYPQMRVHLAQTFPAALVIEHTSGLDFGLLRQSFSVPVSGSCRFILPYRTTGKVLQHME